MRLSLTQWVRLGRIARSVVVLSCLALLLGAVAHAAHIHKDSAHGHKEAACQACLQLDRSAPAPQAGTLTPPALLVLFASLPATSAEHSSIFTQAYDARGPPAP